MRAENSHQIGFTNIQITIRNLVNRIEVALHHNSEIAATAFTLKHFLGDVRDEVLIGIDMDHHAFDGVVANHSAEHTTHVELLACRADARQRLATGNHRGHLDETVARGKVKGVGILQHVDVNCLLELALIEDMAENAVICRDEILALGLHHNMRIFKRFNRIDGDNVYRPLREATKAIPKRETHLRKVERVDFVRDVDNRCIGYLGQNSPLYRCNVVVGSTPIACQRDNCHRLLRNGFSFAKVKHLWQFRVVFFKFWQKTFVSPFLLRGGYRKIDYLCRHYRRCMAEQILQIENVDPKELHGPNDKHLDLVKSMFPKLKIIARGDFVKVMGDEDEIDYFISRYETLMMQLERFGKLTAQTIEDVMMASTDTELQQKMSESDVLVFGRSGVPIKAITTNQKRMVTASEQKDLIFAIGPAGTGKTYTAVALAVRALKAKQVRRIILTRPAVEADEHLGFLPGDLKDKLDPYLQPLYDALRDMIPSTKLEGYLEDHTIEIAPLAFMRGRTLDHAFVILDEAQNATRSQLKMFLTRMGRSAKFIVTGDITQIDLPPKTPSGLPQAMEVLKDVRGIEFIYLDDKDVVRHKLVTDIINAYKKHHDTEEQDDGIGQGREIVQKSE